MLSWLPPRRSLDGRGSSLWQVCRSYRFRGISFSERILGGSMQPLPPTDQDKSSVVVQWGIRPDGKFRSLEGVYIVKPPRCAYSNDLIVRCEQVAEKSRSKASTRPRKSFVEVRPPSLFLSACMLNLRFTDQGSTGFRIQTLRSTTSTNTWRASLGSATLRLIGYQASCPVRKTPP